MENNLCQVKYLVIPFLIWSVLILTLDILLGNPYSVRDFLFTIITGKARVPYYFVPLVVQLLILSPLLVSLARTRYKLLLILTGLIQLISIGSRYDSLLGLNTPVLQPFLFMNNAEFFTTRIFSFSFGIVCGLHFSQFKQGLIRFRWALLGSTVMFFILGVVEWEFLLRFSTEIFYRPKRNRHRYFLCFVVRLMLFCL